MIIVGYQGIGKSTVAGKNNIIDLESGNFWDDQGYRPASWYIFYCNIAEHLSKQGYTVFVSSHEVVRIRLKLFCKEPVAAIVPGEELKDEWIKKLRDRYESTKLEKDYKALMNAEDRYIENIQEINRDINNCFFITSMDYDLLNIIDMIKEQEFKNE